METQKAYLSKHYWKEHTLWSDGYFVCSNGNISRRQPHSTLEVKAELDSGIHPRS
jgi:REP element-mobilizing transposase RayT